MYEQIFRSIDSNSVRKFPNDPKEAISKVSFNFVSRLFVYDFDFMWH